MENQKKQSNGGHVGAWIRGALGDVQHAFPLAKPILMRNTLWVLGVVAVLYGLPEFFPTLRIDHRAWYGLWSLLAMLFTPVVLMVVARLQTSDDNMLAERGPVKAKLAAFAMPWQTALVWIAVTLIVLRVLFPAYNLLSALVYFVISVPDILFKGFADTLWNWLVWPLNVISGALGMWSLGAAYSIWLTRERQGDGLVPALISAWEFVKSNLQPMIAVSIACGLLNVLAERLLDGDFVATFIAALIKVGIAWFMLSYTAARYDMADSYVSPADLEHMKSANPSADA